VKSKYVVYLLFYWMKNDKKTVLSMES